jgi:hypothetical protein
MAACGDPDRSTAQDWARYRDRRSARRAAARSYHPDLGWSAEEMISALIAIDAHFVPGHGAADAPIVIVVRRGIARRLRMRALRWHRRRRARRYFSI